MDVGFLMDVLFVGRSCERVMTIVVIRAEGAACISVAADRVVLNRIVGWLLNCVPSVSRGPRKCLSIYRLRACLGCGLGINITFRSSWCTSLDRIPRPLNCSCCVARTTAPAKRPSYFLLFSPLSDANGRCDPAWLPPPPAPPPPPLRPQVRFVRQTRKDQKAAQAARRLEIKKIKEDAERLAAEEEAALTAGLDDLEKVLMRSTIRAKVSKRARRGIERDRDR